MSENTKPPPSSGQSRTPSSHKSGVSTKTIMISLGLVVVIGSTVAMAAKMYRGDEPEPEEKVVITKAPLITDKAAASLAGEKEFVAKVTCDKTFARGMLMDTSQVKVPRGSLTIANRHHYEMMVMFYTTSANERMQAVGLNPLENLVIKVPVGKYKIAVLTGEDWCNLETGFKESAVKVNLDGMLLVSEDRKPTITFTSEGSAPRDFGSKLSVGRLDEDAIKRELAKDFKERNESFEDVAERRYQQASDRLLSTTDDNKKTVRRESRQEANCAPASKAAPPVPDTETFKNGQLTISPSPDGYFYLTGAVNGFPTVFSYAPSEPMVSISQSTAFRAGIKACVQASGGKSAGGGNRTCVARVSQLAVGGFKLRNVDVTIVPVPNADSVIGMNALREFKIEQAGSLIKIEKPPIPVVANAR